MQVRMVTDTLSMPATSLERAARARRGLLLFFAALIPLSALLQAGIIGAGGLLSPGPGGVPLVLVLMFVPTLAAIIARVVNRDGAEWGMFRLGGRRGLVALVESWLLPVVVGGLAYGAAWATGLVGFAPPDAGAFLAALGQALTLITVIACLSAAGEEIGWRGYLVLRLVEAGVPWPGVVSGLLWAAWHVPLILAGSYASGPNAAVSVAGFVVGVTAIGVLMARMRLLTGSLWPAILLHGAWNAVIQGAFDPAVTGPGAALWTGESGLLTAITLVVVTALLTRRHWRR